MDIHSLTCPHGHGFWHLIMDLWWVFAFIAMSPVYWFKAKIKKFTTRAKNNYSAIDD